jgi:3-oxoacyl-[acyl-carrier protein] reductase
MTASLPEAVTKAMLENIPMKKYGQPEDVAHMVAFLASDKANYITGQIMEVNGGMNM